MISIPLVKRDLKENWKFLLGSILFFGSYTALMVGVYDIVRGQEIQTVTQSFAYYLCMILGIHMGVLSDLNQFLSYTVYGFLFLLIPMVFSIVTARRLMVKMVRNGMMVWILSTPNGRSKVGGTQAFFLIMSLAVQTIVITVVGLISMAVLPYQGGDPIGFLMINLGAFLLHFLISGFCFFISCSVNGNKAYYRLSIGFLGIFFLLHLIGNLEGFFAYANYGTIFAFYQTQMILNGENRAYLFMTVMGLLGVFWYWAGAQRFKKKNFT